MWPHVLSTERKHSLSNSHYINTEDYRKTVNSCHILYKVRWSVWKLLVKRGCIGVLSLLDLIKTRRLSEKTNEEVEDETTVTFPLLVHYTHAVLANRQDSSTAVSSRDGVCSSAERYRIIKNILQEIISSEIFWKMSSP